MPRQPRRAGARGSPRRAHRRLRLREHHLAGQRLHPEARYSWTEPELKSRCIRSSVGAPGRVSGGGGGAGEVYNTFRLTLMFEVSTYLGSINHATSNVRGLWRRTVLRRHTPPGEEEKENNDRQSIRIYSVPSRYVRHHTQTRRHGNRTVHQLGNAPVRSCSHPRCRRSCPRRRRNGCLRRKPR